MSAPVVKVTEVVGELTVDDLLPLLRAAIWQAAMRGVGVESGRCAFVRKGDKVGAITTTFEPVFVGTLAEALAYVKREGLL